MNIKKILDVKCACGGAMRLIRWPTINNDNKSYKVDCAHDCGTSVEGLHDWEETKALWNEAQGPF